MSELVLEFHLEFPLLSGLAIDHPDDNDNKKRGEPNVYITVYSNGFVINDGPFRSLDDEKNRNALKSIQEG